MTNRTPLLLLCLELCFSAWFSVDAIPASSASGRHLELTKVAAVSPVEGQRKWDVKELPTAELTRGRLETERSMENLSAMGGSNHWETINGRDGDETNGHTRGNDLQRHEETRQLVFVKQHEPAGIENTEYDSGNLRLNHRILHKRNASPRGRRTLSVSNALTVFTDMILEHEQRILAQEREDMRRKLMELGKRSEDTVYRSQEPVSDNQYLESWLQRALTSAETN